jgi:hypothetical protein
MICGALQAYERFGGMSGWRALVAGQLDARLGLRAEHATGAWATLRPYLEVCFRADSLKLCANAHCCLNRTCLCALTQLQPPHLCACWIMVQLQLIRL